MKTRISGAVDRYEKKLISSSEILLLSFFRGQAFKGFWLVDKSSHCSIHQKKNQRSWIAFYY